MAHQAVTQKQLHRRIVQSWTQPGRGVGRYCQTEPSDALLALPEVLGALAQKVFSSLQKALLKLRVGRFGSGSEILRIARTR